MAGSSTRGKSPGSGYQGSGAKTDYSSNARDSYGTTIAGNQRQNSVTSNSTTVSKSPGSGYQGAGAKTDYASNARDSYNTAVGRQTTVNKSPTNPIGRRYAEPIGPKMPGKTRGIGSFFTPAVAKPPAKKPPAAKPPAKKPTVSAKPATRGSTAPTRTAQPSRMAVNPRTGNTTGFTTGKTTGSSVSKSGVAGKTTQSAYGRQMSNAARNQPAGPMGGGGGGRGGSMGSSGSSSRSAGSSRTGGTRTNEPAGPRRG